MTKNTCSFCDDGNGGSVYPFYGKAEKPYPSNFTPDEDGLGVFTHCPKCSMTDSEIKNVIGLPVEVVESLKEVC